MIAFKLSSYSEQSSIKIDFSIDNIPQLIPFSDKIFTLSMVFINDLYKGTKFEFLVKNQCYDQLSNIHLCSALNLGQENNGIFVKRCLELKQMKGKEMVKYLNDHDLNLCNFIHSSLLRQIEVNRIFSASNPRNLHLYTNLHTLYLNNRNVSIPDLPNLKVLHLSRVKISNIGKLPSLLYLRVRKTKMKLFNLPIKYLNCDKNITEINGCSNLIYMKCKTTYNMLGVTGSKCRNLKITNCKYLN